MTGLDGVNALWTSSFAHQVISCHQEPAPSDPPTFYGCRFSTFSTCFCHGGAFAHGNSSSVPSSARSTQVTPSARTHESSTVRWRQVYVVIKKWMSKKRTKAVPRWLRWLETLASLANDCKDNLNVAWWKLMFNDIHIVCPLRVTEVQQSVFTCWGRTEPLLGSCSFDLFAGFSPQYADRFEHDFLKSTYYLVLPPTTCL